MSLWSEFLTNDQRTIHKWTHYFPAYERHLARYVNRPLLLVEIGCSDGGSLQMWKRYFGPYAQIVGLDLRQDCAGFEEPQIAVRIGHQADHAWLANLIEEFGAPDIVIDDGSHIQQDVLASFRFLYPRLNPNGVYVVEDLHTAYWPEFGGGLKRDGSFIEVCKSLLDDLNADLSRGTVQPTPFSRLTLSMHFYDSLAIFERGRHLPKHAPHTGASAPSPSGRGPG
ncbi:MAG: class I SAM-dependent methyltransferase [Pseudomonadota bacterium]|nr:class I SAM-dependent methyltransferase [Pseudomonadota bacterium]